MKYRQLFSANQIRLILLLLILFLVKITPASAHTQGALQLTSAPAGPYMVSVWTAPQPAETGEMHISISVALAEDASPVLDADVLVTMDHFDDNETISAPATTDNSENKFFYEAILDIEKNGRYEVTIQVSGDDGAAGETSFELEVLSGSNLGTFIIIGGVVILLALLLFGVFRRRSSKQSDQSG